ncbi:MAG TPA: glutamate--tRNA ligase family protein [Terriglobales bacterium]|jgi:glutamyl-tRNA synthetase|nr:glutamate--tRNA ligase family protein [Terriglobales bacterium]
MCSQAASPKSMLPRHRCSIAVSPTRASARARKSSAPCPRLTAAKQAQFIRELVAAKFPSLAAAERVSGRPAALRFIAPEAVVRIEDGVQGLNEYDARTQLGDFPILRRVGMPAYQLAVVVDDARQGVTEILRGADLLDSCARQWLLQDALGYDHPRWWHVPLVTDESGRRLAKRSDDLSLARLRDAGTDPRRIVSWVARSAAIDVPPRVDAREIIARFEIERWPRTEVRITHADLKEFGLI